MGVFGNSNSLPISLVLSLSQTIQGLHWDRIPGDNDDEVAARGILYLLIFQQLGQLVRWSWGYHVLLAPKERYEEYNDQRAEEGSYRDEPSHDEHAPLIQMDDSDTEANESDTDGRSVDSRTYEPPGRTPVGCTSRASEYGSTDDEGSPKKKRANGVSAATENDNLLEFPHIRSRDDDSDDDSKSGLAKISHKAKNTVRKSKASVAAFFARSYKSLPRPVQVVLGCIAKVSAKAGNFIWEFMNPPLWAMLIAVLVASIPGLQSLFFEEGSFVRNSVTRAVESNGGVAVPLILVVLGANLARNTMARADNYDPEEEEIGTKLLVASLLSRMVIPTIIMAPILAVIAKFLPISILDDPIFVVVCFLLTGAPSALQLAQICQINNVYEKTMGRILFQSYVIW